MSRMKVSVFGLQTGTELVGRIRYMHGHRAVSDVTADKIRVNQLNIPQTVSMVAAENDGIVFVDTIREGAEPYVDEIATDEPTQAPVGLYDALLVSTVQPASYVRLQLSGGVLRPLVNDLCASGLYEVLTITRHGVA